MSVKEFISGKTTLGKIVCFGAAGVAVVAATEAYHQANIDADAQAWMKNRGVVAATYTPSPTATSTPDLEKTIAALQDQVKALQNPTKAPTELPTEKAVPPSVPATAVPTQETTTKKEGFTDTQVWPGELPRSDVWKGETNSDAVWKTIFKYEVDNAGKLDNNDSLRTSLLNRPTSLKPLSSRFTPGQPVKEAGFGLTVENLKEVRSAKEVFADAKHIKLGNILEQNSNDIYAALVYAAANDRDAMALYLAAGILAKQDPGLAGITYDELLEKLRKSEFKKAGELARLQAMILNQTQENYLGTSEGEKNRRSDPKSGDLSGLLPEQFRKPDQFRTCDVRRPSADERKKQPQYILDGVNHVENGKNTRNEADNVQEGTTLIVSSDATGKKFIVGQFTNRKVTSPEKEYKDNSLSPDAARGSQELTCGQGKAAPTKTAVPGTKPEVTPGKPHETPPVPTPTPPKEVTVTPANPNKQDSAPPIVNTPAANPADQPTYVPTEGSSQEGQTVATPVAAPTSGFGN